ncbi:MAG: S8 family serine peptidase [Planctomycetes bacterium]|nr:S8 family serine peptidase [Planctomycetota bacterium]
MLIRLCAAALYCSLPLAAQAVEAPPAGTDSRPGQSLAWAEANRRAELPRWLSLKFAEFDTSGPAPAVPADLAAAALAAGERGYFLVQMRGPVTDAAKAALGDLGLELLDYVPNHAFMARATSAEVAAAVTAGAAIWSSPLHPAYRIDPELLRPHTHARLAVLGFPGVTAAMLRRQLEAAGATVDEENDAVDRRLAIVRPGAGGAAALARCADVQWVEPESIVTERNDTMTWTVQSGITNSRTIWNRGLHGEGQVIGHQDGAIRSTSCYFNDTSNPIGPNHRKLVYYSGTGSNNSHGTHTAGTAAGDAFPINGSTALRGLAYAARLAHSNDYSASVWSARAASHAAAGARMHTNSWGNDSTTAYNSHCNAIDAFSWANEENLVFFAETNLSTLKNPENAKNLVAVGNAQNGLDAVDKCGGGVGPTADGRRKPDLFTPGCSIVSASTGTCGSATLTGTSMACPSATAAGALVRQYFMAGFYPSGTAVPTDSFAPTGALVKAVLVNTCQDMTGVPGYPSDSEGWGHVVLDESLHFSGDTGRLWVVDVRRASGLSTSGVKSYAIDVTSTLRPLEVTLAFTDYAGTVNASNPVVDDLDLVVFDPNGVQYRGNVFSGGWSSAGGVADAKNNVERVAVPAPVLGTWTIEVRGTAVPVGPCGFGLCATGMLDGCFALASITNFGTGKPGTNGVPVLSGTRPVVPSTWTVTVTNGLPNWVAVAVWGFSEIAVPFDGATLYAAPDVLTPIPTNPFGIGQLLVPLPPDPSYCGVTTWWQAWVPMDPGAAGEGYSASNAFRMTMGN